MELLSVRPLESLRDRRSAKWRTYSEDVLPLPVAEMDVELAPPIAEALREALDRSDTGYPAAVPALGKALAGFAAERWGWQIVPGAVTPVADVEEGVVQLLRALVRPGDKVVVCPPVYPPFFDWIREVRGWLCEVPLVDGRLDVVGLQRVFATNPAVLLVCNPHNPVGRVHSVEELADVVRLARRHRVVVISDEIFGPLVLPGSGFTPILAVSGAAEVAVSVVSASKAWNLAGLKCATIVTASAAMAEIVGRIPARIPESVGHFGALATIAAYTDGVQWLDRLLATLDDRRALLGRLLAERLPTLSWRPPQATYLAWLDCSTIGSGDEPWQHFLDKARVATVPGPRFGAAGSGHIRLNFATSAEILDAATARMAGSLALLSE